MQTFTLKVIDIREENSETKTICFKQPGLKKIIYKSGQYITLIFKINGRRFLRPYSFSSSPIADKDLEVTIKRIPKGIISNHICDLVKIGDVIEALPPMGDFILPERENFKSIYLWGAGSGITPLISIAKSILSVGSDIKVNLFYGNRNMETTIFHKEIAFFKETYSNNFSIIHFHTQLKVEDKLPHIVQGRINPEVAIQMLNKNHLDNSSLHYICGPIGLKKSVKEILSKYNILEENIFTEDFELIRNPEDFINIKTQNIKLNFEKREHTIEVVKGKSILEAALDAGLNLPYSCQTGNCSTCKGKLLEGSVKMIGLKENRDDLQNEDYLLCCSHPLNNQVYIIL